MLIYTKLWLLLEKRGMKRTDLKEIMSSATLAKLGKNEPVSSTVIAKICDFLNCQPNDIMENVTKENIEKASGELNEKVNEMFGLDLPESDDYLTVGGLILNQYQSFPKLHELVRVGRYQFKIIKVTATKIELVRLKVME